MKLDIVFDRDFRTYQVVDEDGEIVKAFDKWSEAEVYVLERTSRVES